MNNNLSYDDAHDETIKEVERVYSSSQRPDLLYTEIMSSKGGQVVSSVWTFNGRTVYATYVSEKIAEKLEIYWREVKKMKGVTKKSLITMVEGVPRHEGLNGRVFGFYFPEKKARKFISYPITKIEPGFEG